MKPMFSLMIVDLALAAPARCTPKIDASSFQVHTRPEREWHTISPMRTSPGKPWSNVSRRFEGENLRRHAPAIYNNLQSVRITAMGSDVTLYVYDDDNFNGTFQAVRVKKGSIGIWDFGSMRNRVRSVICQRDPRLTGADQDVDIGWSLQDFQTIILYLRPSLRIR